MATVYKNDNDDYGHRQRRRRVAHDLGAVFFKKIDGMPDFEGKLVGLQFFAGDSSHENLRLGNPNINTAALPAFGRLGQAGGLSNQNAPAKRSTIAY
jgi:hypothetical protein